MRTRPLKLLLFVLTAGGVAAVVKQRVGDSSPPPQRAAEPFMRPSQPVASPPAAVRPPDGSSGDDEPAEEAVEAAPSVESPADTDPQPEPEPVSEPGPVSEAVSAHEAVSEPDGAAEPDGVAEADAVVEREPSGMTGTAAVARSVASTTVELDLEQIAAEREAASPVDSLAVQVDDASGSAPDSGGIPPLPQPPHGPFTVAPQGPADDLGRISGVGPKLQRLLNEQGITQLAQIAGLSDAEVDTLQSRIVQFPGRIRRDRWVEQAKRLTAGN